MKNFVVFVILLSCVGCSYLSTKKFVENNVFYSENMPKLQISVDSGLSYDGFDEKVIRIPKTPGSEVDLNRYVSNYIFRSSSKDKQLIINFEKIDVPLFIFVVAPDFSGEKGYLKTGKQRKEFADFYYGIRLVRHRNPCPPGKVSVQRLCRMNG